MDNINDLNNFLNERKVTVKRRYTEAYPARNVSTAARVRNAILDAVADGHITEEEMSKILSELKAHKRWLSRNKDLFNISEDQTGIKTYALSPYGHRVKNRTRPSVLNEALNVPHKDRGGKPVNIFVGRFQPFTLGHVKVFEKMYKENGYPVVVYLVRGGKPDPLKRPFDEDLQQAMFAKMARQYPFLETAVVVPNGAIDTLFSNARPTYEPMMWGFGTDRKKSYDAMINKQSYRDQLGVHPEFKGFEIKRTDDNISASKVRNALQRDDEKTFKKMTPKSIHKFYQTLRNTLEPIKENKNMKNLKSLNDFNVNESKLNEGAFPTSYTVYAKGKVTYTGQQFKDNANDWGQSERDIAEQMAGDLGLVNGKMYWGPSELNIEGTDKDGREIIVQQKGEYNMYGGPYTPQMKKFNVVLSKGTLTGPILKAFKQQGWDIKGSGGYPDISRTDIWGHLMPSNYFMQGGKNKMR